MDTLNTGLARTTLWSQSLGPRNHLGIGLSVQFRCLRFLLTGRGSLGHPLTPDQFVLAVAAPQANFGDGAPSADQLKLEQLMVLRVQELEALPEPDTREGKLCELLRPSAEGASAFGIDTVGMGILRCELLGMFELQADGSGQPLFSSNLALFDPAVCLHLYRADTQAMEMLTNGTVEVKARIELGLLRSGEDLSYLEQPHAAHISMLDIRGKRTAMFGKTRLGKSNVVKLIVQGMLDITAEQRKVGQLIFDVNGEYANSNPQDGDLAIATVYKERCLPFFLTDLRGNPEGILLRFNFYERTHDALEVMSELLPEDVVQSPAVRSLFTCQLGALERLPEDNDVQLLRRVRKLMLFWAILDSAGFECDSDWMKARLQRLGMSMPFNPGFSQNLRKAAYLAMNNTPPPSMPFNFSSMALEMRVVARFSLVYPNDPSLSQNGQFIFGSDESIMVDFLCQATGAGTMVLRPCLQYHSPVASDFTHSILSALAAGKTVVINLGSADEQIIRYFAKSICQSIFHEQERQFVSNQLNGHYVQIYFEEAHMIFPPNAGNLVNVYSRFAKEGAKFNIGIVYSTQSPTSVSRDLLSQTENFFIGHLSSDTETKYLSAVQAAFRGCEAQILRNRTPGYMHVLTYSHRYVVPIQAHRYDGKSRISA
jgi:hypothetical protein